MTPALRIPRPNWNPFTLLFNFVSCPNYTYEVRCSESVCHVKNSSCSDAGLGELHPHDAVRPCRDLHPGRRLPDDSLGPRQAQELQDGVQGEGCTWCTLSGTLSLSVTISGLSNEKKGSHSIHTLKRKYSKSDIIILSKKLV